MKKNLLLGLGASALVALTLTACGGTTAAPQDSTAPASGGTASSAPSPAKLYTNEELVGLVGQIKATDGSSPAVLSG